MWLFQERGTILNQRVVMGIFNWFCTTDFASMFPIKTWQQSRKIKGNLIISLSMQPTTLSSKKGFYSVIWICLLPVSFFVPYRKSIFGRLVTLSINMFWPILSPSRRHTLALLLLSQYGLGLNLSATTATDRFSVPSSQEAMCQGAAAHVTTRIADGCCSKQSWQRSVHFWW